MYQIAEIILVLCICLFGFLVVDGQNGFYQNARFSTTRKYQNIGGSQMVNRTKVIWMVPSWSCTGNHSINVEKYGIVQNEDQKFSNGSKFAIFYERAFGRVPYFEGQDQKKPKNGGLPQLGNLEEHLRITAENISTIIPDENFDGIAVIDIEEFRPLWSLSWGKFTVYKTQSIQLVRQQHPYWSNHLVEKHARNEYELASKAFFLETLRLAKKLRPRAKWGYYLFPKCNQMKKTSQKECSLEFQKYNEEMSWLWKESTGLFPSIYLYPRNKYVPEENFIEVAALLAETRRIKRNYCPSCETHIFTTIEYDPYHTPEDFYSKQNLASTIENTMSSNVKSIVIWSTSAHMKKRCDLISGYVDSTLGPFLQLMDRKLDKCREERCSSHGECYLRRAVKNPSFFHYKCRCEYPFSGRSCENENFTPRISDFKSRPTPKFMSISRRKYDSANDLYHLANAKNSNTLQ